MTTTLKKLSSDIDKAIQRAIKTASKRKNMKVIAEHEAGIIRDRTRKGYGVLQRGKAKHKLKRLALSTKRARRKKRLHPSTSPDRSNLTETGQMLNALYGRSDRAGEMKVAVRSKRRGTSKTNDEVVFFTSGDRPFLELSTKELREVTKLSTELIQNEIAKELTKI